MSAMDLALFQFGPVQGFIEQAETLGMLRAGSAMLSALAAAALGGVPAGSRPVFPAEGVSEGVPNRFLAFVPRGEGPAAMRAAEGALRACLRGMAEEALAEHPEWACDGAFLRQAEAFPQVSWAVLEDPPARMGDAYAAICRRMALRRNTRAFAAWHEEATGRAKDILSGREAALDARLGFGAMNLIKHARAERLGRAEEMRGYVAVLAMDGDTMGKRIGKFATEAEHRDFSRALSAFAGPVRERVAEHRGELVYVGGDDVLAVLPAAEAVACARALAAAFAEHVGGSASAGIAVGHASVPWQELVHWAHAAESRAKLVHGRNALALAIHKRTGEILEWGSKWDSPALGLLAGLAARESLGRFPYKLAGLLRPYALRGALPQGLRDTVLAEAGHALAQTEGAAARVGRREMAAALDAVCAEERAEDFLGLFLCAAFLTRKAEEVRDAD